MLHLFQDLSRHLRSGHLFVAGFNPSIAVFCFDDLVRHHADVFLHDLVIKATTDQALDREQGVFRIGDRLALGALPDQGLAVFIGDDRGRGARAFSVFDDFNFVAFHHGNT